MQEGSLLLQQSDTKSKINIINWINDLLKINILKIEQLGSGSIYCQILDSIYPGHVPMSKINWQAKYDYEFLQNFKVLQKCFDHLGVNYKIEVDKLIKCKFIDNYEFINWFYKYYQINSKSNVEYDAVGRRGGLLTNINFDFAQNVQLNTANKENTEKYYSQQKQYVNSQKQYYTNQQSNRLSQFQISNYKMSLLNGNHHPYNANSISKYNSLRNYEKNYMQQQMDLINVRVEDHPLYLDQSKVNDFLIKQLKEIKTIISLDGQSAEEIKSKVNQVIQIQEDITEFKLFADQFNQTFSSIKQNDTQIITEHDDHLITTEQKNNIIMSEQKDDIIMSEQTDNLVINPPVCIQKINPISQFHQQL